MADLSHWPPPHDGYHNPSKPDESVDRTNDADLIIRVVRNRPGVPYADTDPDLIRRSGWHLKYPATVRMEFKKVPLKGRRQEAEDAEGLNPELRFTAGEHRFYGRIEPK